MAELIDKSAIVDEIEKLIADETESIKSFEHSKNVNEVQRSNARIGVLTHLRSLLNTLEVKEIDEMIHTIIAECCDWLASCTNLSHNEIEDCRNLMLTAKEEQLKAQ